MSLQTDVSISGNGLLVDKIESLSALASRVHDAAALFPKPRR